MNQTTNSSYSNTISSEAQYSAETFLSARLGQSYYNSYISFSSGQSYGNLSYAYFNYNVPFSNGTTTRGIFSGQGGATRILGIIVTMRNTTVVGYIGPRIPYIINITGAHALRIANLYGVYNASLGIEGVVSPNVTNLNSPYSVAWAVTSGDPLKGQLYPGVYVDAFNGVVLGQFMYNPAILSAQGGSSRFGTAGNFNLFTSNQTITQPSSDSQYILPLLVLAFIMLFLGLYISRKGA